jgi:hypothetical protein
VKRTMSTVPFRSTITQSVLLPARRATGMSAEQPERTSLSPLLRPESVTTWPWILALAEHKSVGATPARHLVRPTAVDPVGAMPALIRSAPPPRTHYVCGAVARQGISEAVAGAAERRRSHQGKLLEVLPQGVRDPGLDELTSASAPSSIQSPACPTA